MLSRRTVLNSLVAGGASELPPAVSRPRPNGRNCCSNKMPDGFFLRRPSKGAQFSMNVRMIVGAGLLAAPLSAQAPTGDPLVALDGPYRARGNLMPAKKEIAGVRTIADAERRKEVVRRKILVSSGRTAGLRRAAQRQDYRPVFRRRAMSSRR